jgi:hypothetical protein
MYGFTVLLLGLGRFFSFLTLYTVGRIAWTGDNPVERPLPTCRTTQTQNKRKQTPMLLVGFEPTIPMFEGAKPFHALDRAATVVCRHLLIVEETHISHETQSLCALHTSAFCSSLLHSNTILSRLYSNSLLLFRSEPSY